MARSSASASTTNKTAGALAPAIAPPGLEPKAAEGNQDSPDPESSGRGNLSGQLVGNRPLSEHRCPLPCHSLPASARRNYGKTTAAISRTIYVRPTLASHRGTHHALPSLSSARPRAIIGLRREPGESARALAERRGRGESGASPVVGSR